MKQHLSLAILAICAIGLLGLYGCANNPHGKRISTTDSLQLIVDTLQVKFDSVDYDRHYKNRGEMMADIDRVERFFKQNNDTMPRDIALQLTEYRLAWKGYKRMEGEYKRIEESLNYSNNQLRTLKTDLENNAVNEQLAQRFLAEELKAISELDINTRAFVEKMRRTEMKYRDKKPVIVELADSLEQSLK